MIFMTLANDFMTFVNDIHDPITYVMHMLYCRLALFHTQKLSRFKFCTEVSFGKVMSLPY